MSDLASSILSRGRSGSFAWIVLALQVAVCPPIAQATEPGEAIAPGSYCALPEPGEQPVCLAPARARHASFFEAIEAGRVDPAATSQLEEILVSNPGSPDAYLALSSLAYGYMNLARQAAAERDTSPVLTARLARWNALLSTSYAEPTSPEHFRSALLEAARDIQDKVSDLGTTCSENGAPGEECSSGLVLALERLESGGPIRSPLRKLVDRFRGDEGNP